MSLGEREEREYIHVRAVSLYNIRLAGGLNIKWQKSELDGYYVISHHAVCQD